MAGGNLIKYTGDVITPTKDTKIDKNDLGKHHIKKKIRYMFMNGKYYPLSTHLKIQYKYNQIIIIKIP